MEQVNLNILRLDYNLKIFQMTLDQIRACNAQLKSLLDKKDYTNPSMKENIKKLKIMIFSLPNLPTQSPEILAEARAFAEFNLFCCLNLRNTKDIELAIDNVRFFYENTFAIPKSSNHEAVKAIHLLSLLSSHRTEDFYTKLENLLQSELQSELIKFVLKLNDAIEEGNYRRIFNLKKAMPLEYFAPFLGRIEDTIRIELAKSAQKAYSVLSVSQALQIFQVESQAQLRTFITDYTSQLDDPLVNWKLEGNRLVFQKINKQSIKFNSEDLIKTTLIYSEELQKIA